MCRSNSQPIYVVLMQLPCARMREGECVNSQALYKPVLRHTVWNAAVLGICGGSFYVTVGWVARLVCVADSYHSLNSVLCAEHFYYVSCLYVIFPVCCVRIVYVCNRAPCWAISMNL